MTASRLLDEMYDLADAYCDGSLDGDGLKRLDQLLLDTSELRRTFTVYVQTVAEVERQGARGTLADPLDLQPKENSVACDCLIEQPSGYLSTVIDKTKTASAHHPFGVSMAVAACAVVVVLSVLAISHLPQRHRQLGSSPTEETAAANIVVLVGGTVDCQWAPKSPALQSGQLVPADQRFELTKGLLKLVYDNQTRCLLEGPVAFCVTADNAIRIESGRLAASVPAAAVGFRVHTPCADVTDLGTEFGVAVEPSKQTAVHVFKGSVRISPLVEGLSELTLAAGQAVELKANGTLLTTATVPADRRDFVSQLPIGPGGGYAESHFDADTEGWRVTLDAHMPPEHKTEAAPHGGYFEAFDNWQRLPERIRHDPMFFSFVAPLPFLGNHRAAYGTHLAFDLRIHGGGGSVKTPRMCQLHGADMVLGFPIETAPNDNTWTHYEIPLEADRGWVRLDLADTPPADVKDLKAVLGDLRRILIPGEFYFGVETAGLDNVVLGVEAASDEAVSDRPQ